MVNSNYTHCTRRSMLNWREKLISSVLRVVELLHLPKVLFSVLSLVPSYPFTDYFHGVEEIDAVRQTFGDMTGEALSNLKIQFIRFAGYMGVNPTNGNLLVNPNYLNKGDELDIYLDLIHELVHIRQWKEGKSLFGGGYKYVERPTEIEAYRSAVEEAKRLGLSSERICMYLKTEWISEDDLRQLAKTLGVECP